MPRIIGMIQKDRGKMEHNLGGWFEKKKKNPPEPRPKKEKKRKKKDEWTENTKRGLANRRKALKELMED